MTQPQFTLSLLLPTAYTHMHIVDTKDQANKQ